VLARHPRWQSDLALNVHFHIIVLDGV